MSKLKNIIKKVYYCWQNQLYITMGILYATVNSINNWLTVRMKLDFW